MPSRQAEVPPLPADSASFAEKLAFYRSQHGTAGNRRAHLVGVPVIVFALPLLVARPRFGVPIFTGGWLLLIGAQRFIEGNLPSTHRGWLTYQLTGAVDMRESYGDAGAARGSSSPAAHAAGAGVTRLRPTRGR